MVQFKVLSGQQAGKIHAAHSFPYQIGRGASAQLRLTDAGVWDQHLEVSLADDGFTARTQSGALASANGASFDQIRLRNGDVLEIGAVKLQFWLAEVTSTGMRGREAVTWIALAALIAGQIALMAKLGR